MPLTIVIYRIVSILLGSLFVLLLQFSKHPKAISVCFISLIPCTIAADEDVSDLGAKCPIFDGISAGYTAWTMAFTAWIS